MRINDIGEVEFTIDDLITALSILIEEDSVGLEDHAEVATAVQTIEEAILIKRIDRQTILFTEIMR